MKIENIVLMLARFVFLIQFSVVKCLVYNLLFPLIMGRSPRIQLSDIHYHVIVRCNNQEFRFETDDDFYQYLSLLYWVQNKHHFKLFNYTLMNTHVHLFLQPSPQIPLSKTMLMINWRYATHYNRQKNRKGHLWLDRYKSIPVESDHYSLRLMRYINLNPIRGAMVQKAGEWKWSGYRFYAYGEPNNLLTPHPSYLALGLTEKCRQKEYQYLVNTFLPGEEKRDPQYSANKYFGSKIFGKKLGFKSKKL